MTTQILRVDASMRREGSVSRAIADDLIEKLSQNNPTNVVTRDLADGIPLVNEAWIGANFTDPQERSTEQRSVLAQSDALVSELKQADILVIATPIYNFHVPAALKAWIDMVARARETFRYTENGPVGLLENKTAYVVVTSGGTQLGSEIDFVSQYLKFVLGFIGITDVRLVDSSGLMIDEQGAKQRAKEHIALVA